MRRPEYGTDLQIYQYFYLAERVATARRQRLSRMRSAYRARRR